MLMPRARRGKAIVNLRASEMPPYPSIAALSLVLLLVSCNNHQAAARPRAVVVAELEIVLVSDDIVQSYCVCS